MPIIIIILLIAFWPAISAFCLAVINTIAAIIMAVSILFTTDHAPQAENQVSSRATPSAQNSLMCKPRWEHRVTKDGTEYCVAPKDYQSGESK